MHKHEFAQQFYDRFKGYETAQVVSALAVIIEENESKITKLYVYCAINAILTLSAIILTLI